MLRALRHLPPDLQRARPHGAIESIERSWVFFFSFVSPDGISVVSYIESRAGKESEGGEREALIITQNFKELEQLEETDVMVNCRLVGKSSLFRHFLNNP